MDTFAAVKALVRFQRLAALFACVAAVAVCDGQEFKYETASVKVSAPTTPKVTQLSGGPGTDDPRLFRAHVNMGTLLQAAFGRKWDQIQGPAWIRDFSASPFYDIVATLPNNTNKEEGEKMLQNLLAERFHLAYRRQTEYFPGFDLVVSKGGPKLKVISGTRQLTTDSSQAAKQPVGRDGFPVVNGSRLLGWRATAMHQRIKFQERTMAEFSSDLTFLIGGVQGKTATVGFLPRVLDRTGLEGRYTFILEYECAACAALTPAPTSPGRAAAGAFPAELAGDSVDFPDLFVALQQQLGLRLNQAADVPTEVIEIERLDKLPVPN